MPFHRIRRCLAKPPSGRGRTQGPCRGSCIARRSSGVFRLRHTSGGRRVTTPTTGSLAVCSVKRVGGTTTSSESFASKAAAMTSSLGDKGSETLCDSLHGSDGLSIIRLYRSTYLDSSICCGKCNCEKHGHAADKGAWYSDVDSVARGLGFLTFFDKKSPRTSRQGLSQAG